MSSIFHVTSESIDMKELEQHISFRKSSKARPELRSPYNFVPFLLPRYFKEIERIIYLDADNVVKVCSSSNNSDIHAIGRLTFKEQANSIDLFGCSG